MAKVTFLSLFENNKASLTNQLENLTLPKDRQKIQEIVGKYFEDMVNEDGELRQSLTESEDYMLQAALTLLNAQQKMVNQMSAQNTEGSATVNLPNEDKETESHNGDGKSDSHASVLAGTVIGGVGGVLLGGWAALFGAIAGTAIMLYSSASKSAKRNKRPGAASTKQTTIKVSVEESPLNVSMFTSILREICISLDTIVSTYRAQVARVVNRYESQSRPTIEQEHRSLLESIQSMIGYVVCHPMTEPNYEKKLAHRVQDLSEMLDSYGIEVVAFDGENSHFFDEVESKQATEPKMTVPAFVKNNKPVLRGKILKPAQ